MMGLMFGSINSRVQTPPDGNTCPRRCEQRPRWRCESILNPWEAIFGVAPDESRRESRKTVVTDGDRRSRGRVAREYKNAQSFPEAYRGRMALYTFEKGRADPKCRIRQMDWLRELEITF